MYEVCAVALVVVFLILSSYVWVKRKWRLLVFLCGLWCVSDGVLSFLLYADQAWSDHMSRLLRTFVGIYLISYAGWVVRETHS